ncbi:MAG TPA: ATPase domain-containing protein [Thermoplasmata archaeon]|nr:ATPase domain-containing protein [Thermoplasmata archaeon]
MRKIRTGIFGLNPLLDGGFNEHSTTVVIGASGAGKTTFATQFIRRALLDGQEGIFVSLDENKEQIIREAVEMGWSDILDYVENELLVFIDASGREFSNFIRKELPAFVADWKGANARIAIDPLTPVMWTTKDAYEQRDLIGFMLKETRKVGTVLATLEEHGPGDLSGDETVIPMYLADSVIHLRYRPSEGNPSRRLKIVKARSTRHSDEWHPYHIMKGLGLIVDHGDFKRSSSAKIPGQLKALLEQKKAVPPAVVARVGKALDLLTDDDFKGMKPEEILSYIIQEFAEE